MDRLTNKREFKSVSKRTKILLNKEEGYDVEYKQSLSGLDPADIVSFANSDTGGTILIGIKDVMDAKGRQRGEIVGCPVGDKERLTVMNIAQSCIPPINVELYVENSEDKPFYRIEIPSGRNKPYCTTKGLYKIRGDGRSNILDPHKLLMIFEETESSKFIERFKKATIELEEGLAGIREHVADEMTNLLEYVRNMESNVSCSLNGIFDSAQSAESLSDNAVCNSDETLNTVRQLADKMNNMEKNLFGLNNKVDVLLKHLNLEDFKISKGSKDKK